MSSFSIYCHMTVETRVMEITGLPSRRGLSHVPGDCPSPKLLVLPPPIFCMPFANPTCVWQLIGNNFLIWRNPGREYFQSIGFKWKWTYPITAKKNTDQWLKTLVRTFAYQGKEPHSSNTDYRYRGYRIYYQRNRRCVIVTMMTMTGIEDSEDSEDSSNEEVKGKTEANQAQKTKKE